MHHGDDADVGVVLEGLFDFVERRGGAPVVVDLDLLDVEVRLIGVVHLLPALAELAGRDGEDFAAGLGQRDLAGLEGGGAGACDAEDRAFGAEDFLELAAQFLEDGLELFGAVVDNGQRHFLEDFRRHGSRARGEQSLFGLRGRCSHGISPLAG